jgi:methylenetetrahydrofolate reductase (NADPH)
VTRIDELLTHGRTTSFEFFPPRTEAGDAQLRRTVAELEPLRPSFVSVTYGAGGSTRETSERWVTEIQRTTAMTPMPHLTAVCHTRTELAGILDDFRGRGLANVLALRGDPPTDTPDPFWEVEHAADLVALAREVGGGAFAIGVAAHPEGHPLSPDLDTDRRHLAAKLRAADFGITQFFFRLQDYLAMVEDLSERGCDTPVIPGVIPVTDVRQIERFARLSEAALPEPLVDRLRAVQDDPEEVRRIGVEVATELSQDLLDAGAPGLHFYTLNKAAATVEIHANLGLAEQR